MFKCSINFFSSLYANTLWLSVSLRLISFEEVCMSGPLLLLFTQWLMSTLHLFIIRVQRITCLCTGCWHHTLHTQTWQWKCTCLNKCSQTHTNRLFLIQQTLIQILQSFLHFSFHLFQQNMKKLNGILQDFFIFYFDLCISFIYLFFNETFLKS